MKRGFPNGALMETICEVKVLAGDCKDMTARQGWSQNNFPRSFADNFPIFQDLFSHFSSVNNPKKFAVDLQATFHCFLSMYEGCIIKNGQLF